MKFALLLFLFSVSVQAQDTVDNGVIPSEVPKKKKKAPKPSQQQQQEQATTCYARKIVSGNEAEELFLKYSGDNFSDLSGLCSKPVQRTSSSGRSPSLCFDRGVDFRRGSRFKCYVKTEHEVNCNIAGLFDLFHNSCGGNGIHPKKRN